MALLRNKIVHAFSSLVTGSAFSIGIMICFFYSAMALGQTNRFLTEGNNLYGKQKYDEAASSYLKALKKDPNNVTGLFNLGNALYKKEKFDTSRKILTATANALKDKNGKAAANYNIGNTYMSQRNWDEAIASYKSTLRNNPLDADAKYNLSFAQAMKKQEDKKEQQKDKQKDKKDQQKDKQKDKGDKDKDKDKQDQKDKGDDKDKQDQKEQKPQSQPAKISQQQADQLLNALQQEEKKLQDKLKKEKGIPVKMDKDW